MKVIDLWECSACGAFYADKITACDCYMDGCTTLTHYQATLTLAGNSQVIPDAYVLDELGRMMLNGVCEPRIGFGSGWNACRAKVLKAQPVMAEQWRSFVTDADIAALHRFAECCDDPESGGHDLEKEQVQRLEKIGALQRSGRISYITDFGDYLISVAPAQESE